MNNTDIMRKVNEINQQNLGKGQGGKKVKKLLKSINVLKICYKM